MMANPDSFHARLASRVTDVTAVARSQDLNARLRGLTRAAFMVLALVTFAACAAGVQPGDMQRGKQLYNTEVQSPRGPLPSCAKCHAVGEGQRSETGLGTNFHDIGTRAAKEVPGQSAEDYLRTSIVDPDAHLAGGYQDGLMSRDYKKLLTAQQIEDLVAYMMTLK